MLKKLPANHNTKPSSLKTLKGLQGNRLWSPPHGAAAALGPPPRRFQSGTPTTLHGARHSDSEFSSGLRVIAAMIVVARDDTGTSTYSNKSNTSSHQGLPRNAN